ncbi:MAG: hypothetical protein KY443_04910 [Actinobacteria bacterium]|nr:hypothetical protein [Actinomycetota bacterium]
MLKDTRARRAAHLALAVAFIGVGAVVMAGPSPALQHPALRIGEGESFTRQYPTIPGNNPANQAYDPETCRLAPYCDVIRLTILPPASSDTSYFVRIQLGWKTRAEVDVPVEGEVTNNDLDMFIFQVPYDKSKRIRQNQVASGATAAQPETAYVSPADDYDIVVVNFVGVNEEGYRLTLTYVAETVFTPFELLEDFRPTTDEPVTDTSGTPVPSGPAAAPSVEQVTGGGSVAPPMLFLGGGPFDDPFGLATPIASISAAARNVLAGPQAGPAPPPGPVSALSALVWLGLVPMAVVATGGWVLARRRNRVFAG